jgi:hypothetical protein
MARLGLDDATIWSEVPDRDLKRRARWSPLGLGALAAILALAFVVRGICWEGLVIAAPAMVVVAAAFRFRDVLVTVGVVVMLSLGFLVVEGVNVYSYHSVSFSGAPHIIVWCGREMAPSNAPVVARSDADLGRLAEGGPVQQVGVTPAGSAIVAAGANAYWGCPWQLYVPVGNDNWEYYTQDPG